ncbi:MAG: hypothetical protein LBT54_01010 [Bifidobacteriaceae bacterium]|nr:hypothetical protein [Bifidobacteriaceae bacterium]
MFDASVEWDGKTLKYGDLVYRLGEYAEFSSGPVTLLPTMSEVVVPEGCWDLPGEIRFMRVNTGGVQPRPERPDPVPGQAGAEDQVPDARPEASEPGPAPGVVHFTFKNQDMVLDGAREKIAGELKTMNGCVVIGTPSQIPVFDASVEWDGETLKYGELVYRLGGRAKFRGEAIPLDRDASHVVVPEGCWDLPGDIGFVLVHTNRV